MPNIFRAMGRAILLLTGIVILSGFNAVNKKEVVDFNLKNVDGKSLSMGDFQDAKGFIIVFTCNHCPFAKLYPPRLNELNTKFKPLGVPVIAINSTDSNIYEEETFAKMVDKAKKEHFNYPYLFDGAQTVAKNFGAQKTPHAFVIWKEKGAWLVEYDGAIDDNGAEPAKVTRHYVADAVNNLLSGKKVAVKETKSIGCQITLRK